MFEVFVMVKGSSIDCKQDLILFHKTGENKNQLWNEGLDFINEDQDNFTKFLTVEDFYLKINKIEN